MDNENILETDRPSSIEIIIQNIVEAFAQLKSISGEYSESVVSSGTASIMKSMPVNFHWDSRAQ